MLGWGWTWAGKGIKAVSFNSNGKTRQSCSNLPAGENHLRVQLEMKDVIASMPSSLRGARYVYLCNFFFCLFHFLFLLQLLLGPDCPYKCQLSYALGTHVSHVDHLGPGFRV